MELSMVACRHLLLGGSKGHIAMLNWSTFRLQTELHLKETVRDVTYVPFAQWPCLSDTGAHLITHSDCAARAYMYVPSHLFHGLPQVFAQQHYVCRGTKEVCIHIRQ
jgi:hypothetical protein